MNNYIEYTKPINILLKSTNVIMWVFFIIITLISASFYIIFGYISNDLQQGQNYMILYIHVPSAWMALMIYLFISISSGVYLINRNPIVHIFTTGGLYLGSIFTLITLVTGSLWGKPMWGTYWVWDARLTSVFILFIIYIINIFINISDKNNNRAVTSSIIVLVGLINIPIIKASVEWWSTLHQPSSIYQLNSAIHASMLIPLLYMTIAFLLIYLLLLLIYLRNEIIKRKTEFYKIYHKK
uniref:ABC transporter subunit C n=1 Tax=Malawimonas californiana TaxID=221722 RepID=A0A0B5GMU1_MALCL|nr:ABC transporter subunit C [Malawimonas californiana]AJF22863.1 ABC transporter subunit C [Malawimonas californiana]